MRIAGLTLEGLCRAESFLCTVGVFVLQSSFGVFEFGLCLLLLGKRGCGFFDSLVGLGDAWLTRWRLLAVVASDAHFLRDGLLSLACLLLGRLSRFERFRGAGLRLGRASFLRLLEGFLSLLKRCLSRRLALQSVLEGFLGSALRWGGLWLLRGTQESLLELVLRQKCPRLRGAGLVQGFAVGRGCCLRLFQRPCRLSLRGCCLFCGLLCGFLVALLAR